MFVGKLLGTVFGYWIFGSIYGAVAGFIFGFMHDRSRAQRQLGQRGRRTESRAGDATLSTQDTEHIRQSFFSTTFSVLGHIAKADGQVNKSEIAQAENIMQQMGLTAELRASAIKLFNMGKHPGFDLDMHMVRFRNDCAQSTSLYRVFLEIQIQSALADGKMVREEEDILLRVADVLGFSERVYRQIELLVRVSMGIGDDHARRHGQGRAQGRQQSGAQPRSTAGNALRDAYALLGVAPDADKALVKVAYRKLMSQHHPDKLISKGLPEEMLKVATDKTQQIQKAYEEINKAKGW